MSLEVSHLTKKYGDQLAVNDISFSIPQSQIVGFLGPNGAGKSTTMKMLTTYIEPTSGDAKVNGYDILTQAMDVKKSIGYLPESNPLYTDMYVKEYLTYACKIYNIQNQTARVAEIIQLTGLQREQDKKIFQLSKGYKQRVGLAQAMIHDPKVLILDEPTSGLDPNQLDEIRQLIIKIGQEKTVLLSTHIMQEVEAMCQRVIIINKGQIVADNETHQLKKSMKTAIITVEFARDIDIKALEKIPNIDSVTQSNGVFKIKLKDKDIDVREQIFEFAVQSQNSILNLHLEEQNIEDVFKELTK